ncbi:hypothetical protein TNCV_3066571 [Trichonephila clavipes]|nr:hypothetical protein TNCV_3066571 [Trichonephila clavipes]
MKEQNCLPEERCKRMSEQIQLLNEEEEKLSDEDMEVTQAIEKVLVFKGEQVQTRTKSFDEDEIEEEKPKLPKRKRQNLSRMTVAELQQNVNLKASSNMVLMPQHWSFRGEYLQNTSEMGNDGFYQARWYCEDTTIIARKSNDKTISI